MQKAGFSSLKTFDGLKSLRSSFPVTESAKKLSATAARTSTEGSQGSFANLKLTAEKLVKEQASVKMDLELANSKLKKTVEQINHLESKLQCANNENAKLKMKQKEDAKLWKGLDSKLSSTKTLCNQLTDTLQHLAGQTSEAEEDKKVFEEMLREKSKSLDDLSSQINSLSEKLGLAGESIKMRTQELQQAMQEKDETSQTLEAERSASECCKKEKDAIINQLKDTIEENKSHLTKISSEAQKFLHDLKVKENTCKSLESDLENLNKEKNALQSINDDSVKKLLISSEEKRHLESVVHSLKSKAVELDKYSDTVSNNLDQLISFMNNHNKLSRQEKDLSMKCAKNKLDLLQDQHLSIGRENEAFRIEIAMLKNKIVELQKTHESVVKQHVHELHLAEYKIQILESEAGDLISRKNDLEMLVSTLEGKVKCLLDTSCASENKMQELLLKLSGLELENKDMEEKLLLTSTENIKKIENLQVVISEHKENITSLENQISELRCVSDEKEQANIKLVEGNKMLEEKKAEAEVAFASSECNLVEVRKQYELMLEGKQLELSKHLKEISLKNDMAINDIRKKYEIEKLEIVNAEKQKGINLIKEIEKKCDERINRIEEERKLKLESVKDEQAAKISQIQEEQNKNELRLKDYYKEEMDRIQHQAETELREKALSLKKEYDIQILSLKQQQEEELKKVHEELELQRAKEERQRALLQLQWNVIDDKSQQNDLEVNSKKEYSFSSARRDANINGKGSQLNRPEKRKKEIDISGIMRTPVANMLRKSERRGNPESVISVPKPRKKVNEHEYETYTSNGKTATKRRKTKDVMMSGNSAEQKRVTRRTPVATGKNLSQVTKVTEGAQQISSNIGDLFREGSLNPYADDPYAFD